jgi:hypothetical protein
VKQTLYRHALKNLKTVSLQVNLLAEECDGSFFPVVKTDLQKQLIDLLANYAIQVVPGTPAQLRTEVRARVLTHAAEPVVLVKIETALKEPVTLQRSQVTTEVDTWRHRCIAAVFSGIPDPSMARQLIESEVLRQVEAFAGDVSLTGPRNEDEPQKPTPVRGGTKVPEEPGEKSCRKIELGAIDGLPEFKTEWEMQQIGPWKTEVPVVYTRTSHAVAYVEACAPKNLLEQGMSAVEGCAKTAAAAVTIAVILAGPEAAQPAFQATFMPCLEAKAPALAAQIEIYIKTDQQASEWRRRT